MKTTRLHNVVLLVMVSAALEACGVVGPNQATLVAEAIAQTQAIENGVKTALAATLEAAPPTETETSPPTETTTNTPTEVPLPDWSGNWWIWMEGLTETEIGPSYFNVVITQTGSTVSLSLDIEGDTLVFSGPLSGDHMTASGVVNYSGSGGTGPAFTWYLTPGGDQFSGNWDGRWFCGARGGGAKPVPCYAP